MRPSESVSTIDDTVIQNIRLESAMFDSADMMLLRGAQDRIAGIALRDARRTVPQPKPPASSPFPATVSRRILASRSA